MRSEGRVTVPEAVRDLLGIAEGDDVVFRIEGSRVVVARRPDVLTLASTTRTPAVTRKVTSDEVVRRMQSGVDPLLWTRGFD